MLNALIALVSGMVAGALTGWWQSRGTTRGRPKIDAPVEAWARWAILKGEDEKQDALCILLYQRQQDYVGSSSHKEITLAMDILPQVRQKIAEEREVSKLERQLENLK